LRVGFDERVCFIAAESSMHLCLAMSNRTWWAARCTGYIPGSPSKSEASNGKGTRKFGEAGWKHALGIVSLLRVGFDERVCFIAAESFAQIRVPLLVLGDV
jgi:hypothetical protein